jgi:hypothetical protein
MDEHCCSPQTLLIRHLSRDWGQVPARDATLNDQALIDGGRLLSRYQIAPGVRVWLITEADRSATTFLLPAEY